MDKPRQSEEAIFEAALQRPPEQRTAYVKGACGEDAQVRQSVEALLRAHEKSGGFLDQPPPGLGPDKTIRLDSSPAEKPGDIIGRYKLLQQIGEGGCGVVYMAEQAEPVRRRVALKVIKLGMDTKDVIARFEAERQALALMDHPNIAKVLDAGATETGRPYFVMELVRGIRITDYCDQNNLTAQQRLELFIRVCQAIQHAHQKGVIHRDIKPSNILVADHDGVPVPKVIDFGIAKATTGQRLTDKTIFTAFEQFIGTPAYMSPEQAKLSGLDIDTRSDIYSLGVLLYELLTGKTPFEAKELLAAGLDEMRRVIREKDPPWPSARLSTLKAIEQTTIAKCRRSEPLKLIHLVRGDLDWIVMKCLEKDRTRRYETANGLAVDLQRYAANEPVVARPPSNMYRFRKMVRRNKVGFAAAAAVAAALLVGITVSTGLFVRERQAERAARTQAERADRNAAQEAVQRQKAEAAALEVRKTLAASDFLQATRLVAEDKSPDALAYLQRCLLLEPSNVAALTRLTSLLSRRNWMMPVFILKHRGMVISAQFSPDGKRIVTASWDNTAQVWDAQSGQPLTEPMKHSDKVRFAQFSPDGKRIVTASWDHTARVWDAQSGQPLTKPMKHSKIAVSAQFSPDGKRIVTASGNFYEAGNGSARVWDAQSGQPLTQPMKHGDVVSSAHFSPDGKRVMTTSDDHTARVWDVQSGQPVTEPMKHGNRVSSTQFSPDGKRILTASWDGTARVWDAQSGQLSYPLKHSVRVFSAEFSPDGKRVVTASADAARVWDAQSGQSLTEPMKHGGLVSSAQFSPDGKRIVTASWDHTARMWDARSGQPLTEAMKHGDQVQSAQFSPDGKRVVTVSDDHTARVWDAQSGQPLTEPMIHDGRVNSAQFSPDGRRLVTASFDYTARVWDAQSGGPLTEPIKHGDQVYSAQFSPDGKRILTASAWTARVWDAQSGQPLTEPMNHVGAVNSAQFSPDGKRIVTASAGTARVWDAQSGQPLTEPMKHDGEVQSAQFSPDGKRVVTASWDNTARVWDAQSGRPLTDPMRHDARVDSAQFSLDGKRIVTASSDHTARLWDLCPVQGAMPDWLPWLVEGLAGQKVNDRGILEPTATSPPELIGRVHQELSRGLEGDDWVIWGRWFLAEPSTRTISPFSKVTVPEYIENRIRENTPVSLDEAERLAFGNAQLLRRISEARNRLEQTAPKAAPGSKPSASEGPPATPTK